MSLSIVYGAIVVLGCILLRLYSILPSGKHHKSSGRPRCDLCPLAIFLGSGGHTSEALMLLSAADFDRYSPRTYIISQGDTLSAKKVVVLEAAKSSGSSPHPTSYRIVTIPRARRVHQSLLTTPFTAAVSLAACVHHVTLQPLLSGVSFGEVLLLNGPGTCVPLCIATYINRFLGIQSPRLLYVESFARVRHLSLSGRILRPFVDRFVVQWPELAQGDLRADCRGWLI